MFVLMSKRAQEGRYCCGRRGWRNSGKRISHTPNINHDISGPWKILHEWVCRGGYRSSYAMAFSSISGGTLIPVKEEERRGRRGKKGENRAVV